MFARRIATFALTLALGTALAVPALAQDRSHGHHGRHGRFSAERMEHRLERLTAELSLDEHQVAMVREILATARTEAEALRGTERGEARREARRDLVERVADRIDAILSDAQRETFARLRAEHAARREARRERRAACHGAPEGI